MHIIYVFVKKFIKLIEVIIKILKKFLRHNDGMRGVATNSTSTFKKLTGVLTPSFYLRTLRSNVLLNAMLDLFLRFSFYFFPTDAM
jgi:hypothetical protein